MKNTITITATAEGAEIKLEYNRKTYIQKLIPTSTGARYEGYTFSNSEEIPEDILDELQSLTAYNLHNCLRINP